MGHPLEDSSHTADSLKYPWKSLLSTSSIYETEIKTSRSNLHLSFELWKRLAELTTETLGISLVSPESPAVVSKAKTTLITSDQFVKTILPPSLPTTAAPKKFGPSTPPPAARTMTSRGRTEKGLIEALIEARRSGATGTAFKRGPGVYSSIIKGPTSEAFSRSQDGHSARQARPVESEVLPNFVSPPPSNGKAGNSST